MLLAGANPTSQVVGLEELPGKANYFIGNDRTKWRTNIPTYAKVRYQEVYPGVDLVYYSKQGQLEYDFVVAPGADPKTISLAFTGAERIEAENEGDLILRTAGGNIRLHRPVVYQEIDGTRKSIAVRYALLGPEMQDSGPEPKKVGFQVAAYDVSKPLIIDPVLSYSTYLGGSNEDRGNNIAVDTVADASGRLRAPNKINMYVTGTTFSTDFPTASPLQPHFAGTRDVFVTKLNATGAIVYSTYLGGNDEDDGSAIAVDAFGNVYVTGAAGSNFPTVNPFQAAYLGDGDAFVTKLNPSGSALIYSTYLGGSNGEGANSIAVDSNGNAYVTGQTHSSDFPTVNAFQAAYADSDAPGCGHDAFVTKVNPSGSALIYSTYLGGNCTDEGADIAVDAFGNVYVTGYTASSNFPTANPLQATFGGGSVSSGDAFVTKLNATGALVYSTYLGGGGDDRGGGIGVDAAGNAYVTGFTASTDFPTVNPMQATFGGGTNDAFVTKINPAGSALGYSTYLGGSGDDGGNDLAVDTAGNVYVSGTTSSIDFPTANPLQPAVGGLRDAFVAKISELPQELPPTILWNVTFDRGGSETAHGVAVGADGHPVVTGSDSGPFRTIKFDGATGAILWISEFGGGPRKVKESLWDRMVILLQRGLAETTGVP